MANFVITDPDTGRTIRLTGDSPPTETELEKIFAEQPTAITPGPGITLEIEAPTQEIPKGPPGFLETLKGEAELAGTIVSGAILEPLAGAAGIVQSLNPFADPGAGARAIQTVRNLSFKPGEAGLQVAKSIGEIALQITPDTVKEFAGFVGNKFSEFQEATFQRYGPIAGTAVAIAPTAILEVIPGFFALKKARNLRTTIADEVIEQADDLARNAGEISLKTEIAPEGKSYQNIANDIQKEKTKNLIDQIRPDAEILESAKNLGVDLNPSHYSTNRAFIEMEQGLKSKPGSTLSTIEEQAILDTGRAADDLIVELGGQTDKSLLDARIKENIDKNIKDLSNQSEKAYGAVNKAVPRPTKANIGTSKSYMENRLEELGGNLNLLTGAEKQLLRLTKAKGKAVPTYGAIDQLRRNVGDAIGKKSGPFKDDDRQILDQLYGVLSDDQQGMADVFGVGSQYAQGRKLVFTQKELQKQAIQLFGRDIEGSILPQLGQVATSIVTKGDVSKLKKLMKALPPEFRQEAAATLLNDFFAFGSRAEVPLGQGVIRSFEALNRNVTAKNELFKHLPKGARKRFDDIGRVATGIFKAKALENKSRTANAILAALDDGSLIQRIIGTKAGKVALEAPGAMVGLPFGASTVIGFFADFVSNIKGPASKAADSFLTSPAFKKSLEAAALGRDKAAEAVKQTKVFKNWLKNQTPDIKTEIAAIGFVPWLTQQRTIEEQ